MVQTSKIRTVQYTITTNTGIKLTPHHTIAAIMQPPNTTSHLQQYDVAFADVHVVHLGLQQPVVYVPDELLLGQRAPQQEPGQRRVHVAVNVCVRESEYMYEWWS